MSYHSRLRLRKIHVYHECGNIDLAVWVTVPVNADLMHKACSQLVNNLNSKEIYLSIAHHTFSLHLIDKTDNRYLGMAGSGIEDD